VWTRRGPAGNPTPAQFTESTGTQEINRTNSKALTEEEFGGGIMGAIDFDMSVARKQDPKGDRVTITMSGKFLPYRTY
jgi:cyanate lyase